MPHPRTSSSSILSVLALALALATSAGAEIVTYSLENVILDDRRQGVARTLGQFFTEYAHQSAPGEVDRLQVLAAVFAAQFDSAVETVVTG